MIWSENLYKKINFKDRVSMFNTLFSLFFLYKVVKKFKKFLNW